MIWTDLATKIIQLLFCEIAAGAAGSIFVIFLMMSEYLPQWRNSRLKLLWMKAAVILFLFPVAALFVLAPRFGFSINGMVAFSDFGQIATPPMQTFYLTLGLFWLTGLGVAAIFRIAAYCRYRNILKGTIAPADDRVKQIAQLYLEKKGICNVRIGQNDRLRFPLTKGLFWTEIILPVREYTEKELHMIMEHECSHVRSHDLFWKRAGLLVTFLHWWNPFSYILLRKLALQMEIECDIRTCEGNECFTMKEYGFYLAGMPEETSGNFFGAALQKSKKDIFRRLEGMVKGKKYQKRTAVVSCILLTVLAAIPSYAASEGFVRANERWARETEAAVEVQPADYKSLEQTALVSADDGIEEIDLTEIQEELPTGETITLDRTIPAKTRVLYHWQTMKKGDIVTISAGCGDSSVVYRVGIRKKTGEMTYVEGSGDLLHPFVIGEAGEYTAYVENRSSKSMKVTGIADYSNR